MDAHRFDALARALSIGSRRGLLGFLFTLPGLGGLLALLDADDVDAKGRRKRRKKRHKHGKGNGRHRKRNGKCQRKSRARICAGKCGIVKNRKTCKKRIDCGPCVACSAAQPCPDGCCAGDGSCQPGNTPQACGVPGATCQVCTDTQLCHEGSCQPCDVCANDCDHNSIQQAISEANAGATIRVCAGTYQEPEMISILKDLTLIGAGDGEDGVILDGQEQGTVVGVRIGKIVRLQGLRITRGIDDSGDGGGVFNAGDLTLTGCTVSGNRADLGGGIYTIEGEVTLTGSTVSGNAANDRGGGIYIGGGAVTLNDSTVSGNTAGFDGGGIFNSPNGTVDLTDSTVSGNTAGDLGGGLFNEGGLTLTDSTVTLNTAGADGGGIFNSADGTVSLESNSHVCDNRVDGEPNNCVGFDPPSGVCTETCPA